MNEQNINRYRANRKLRKDCLILVKALQKKGYEKKEIADLMGISAGYFYDKVGTTRHFSETDRLSLEVILELDIDD